MTTTNYDPRGWLRFVPDTLQASALYAAWWQGLKHDAEMQELMHLVAPDQPQPITFFTVINYLVLKDPSDPLARLYPALSAEATLSLTNAYARLQAFVKEQREEIEALLPTARLQTNEVTRCANLLPAFVLAYERGGYQPLQMIELGSSAGLHLLWSQYHYTYHIQASAQQFFCGEATSPVHIRCAISGPRLPLLPPLLPRVAYCQGIELLPRDVHNEQDMRWVRAAIWPEEVGRYQLLDAAIRFARQCPLRVHEGDASLLLPGLLSTVPPAHTVVLWHSFALNQGPAPVKERIEAHIAAASISRTIYRVSLEVEDASGAHLDLWTYAHGEVAQRERLASCALHGERMTWLHEGA